MAKTSFRPWQHGFHFPNSFVNTPLRISLPYFQYAVQTSGRCGGMSFAALDYFFANLPVPTHRSTLASGKDFPDPATSDFAFTGHNYPVDQIPRTQGYTLGQYIYDRLGDSLVGGIQNLITNLGPNIFSTLNESWIWQNITQPDIPRITDSLDRGTPAVLGLIGGTDGINLDPFSVGQDNHQVVAWDYDDLGGGAIDLHIYDCNSPDTDMIYSIRPTAPHVFCTLTAAYASSPSSQIATVNGVKVRRWRGLFLETYTPKIPLYTDLVLTQSVTTSASTPNIPLGSQLNCHYAIQNIGHYPARSKTLYAFVRGPGDVNLDGFFGADLGTGSGAVDVNGELVIPPGGSRTFSKSCDSFGVKSGDVYRIGFSYLSAAYHEEVQH